jgi:hypothetical protein
MGTVNSLYNYAKSIRSCPLLPFLLPFSNGAQTGAFQYIVNGALAVSANFRPPGWAGKLIFGSNYIGQGGSVGGVVSFPFPGDPEGEFDIGAYVQGNAGGQDVGTGRYSVGLNYQTGNIREGFNGKGAEYSFNDGVGGLSLSLNANNVPNGVGMHIGGGYNVGGSATMSGAVSIRQLIDLVVGKLSGK